MRSLTLHSESCTIPAHALRLFGPQLAECPHVLTPFPTDRVLTAEQIKAESATLRELLFEDAISQVPACIRPELCRLHAETPFKDARGFLKAMDALKHDSKTRIFLAFEAMLLYHATSEGDGTLLQAAIGQLTTVDLQLCRYWSPTRQPVKKDVSSPDETVTEDAQANKARDMTLNEIEVKVAGDIHPDAICLRSLFSLAVYTGHLSLLRMFIEACGPTLVRHASAGYSLTALHIATSSGQVAACMALLEAGAEVGAVDAKKRSALHIAAERGYAQIVRLLVEAGDKLDETSRDLLMRNGNASLATELAAAAPMDDEGVADEADSTNVHASQSAEEDAEEALYRRFCLHPSLCDDPEDDFDGDDYGEPEPQDEWESEEEEEEEAPQPIEEPQHHSGSEEGDE